MNNETKKIPKVLVISNNPFSQTSNNGKTLASFFKGFPSENVAQLYFSSEIPSEMSYNKYFQITDMHVLESIISFEYAGGVVEPKDKGECAGEKETNTRVKSIPKTNLSRVIREIIWKIGKWKSSELVKWLEEFDPDIIFFCAGDSGFVYDIVSFVEKITGAKLITYITDDYILPRYTISIFWWIRRNVILEKMRRAITRSSLFVTISDEMRVAYKKMFNKDSIVVLNMAESMKIDKFSNDNFNNDIINLIYAGGLHYNRHESLILLADAIKEYNGQSDSKQAFLSIYSGTRPSDRIIQKLNTKSVSKYFGSLNPESLKIKLNEADIPVHVESFDKKSTAATKLSVSTKIPEYLSLGKPILAIGPSKVASMKYLDGAACCITNKEEIVTELSNFLNNQKSKEELANLSKEKYESNHNLEIIREKFQERIINICK